MNNQLQALFVVSNGRIIQYTFYVRCKVLLEIVSRSYLQIIMNKNGERNWL